jgi:hypothetical protein
MWKRKDKKTLLIVVPVLGILAGLVLWVVLVGNRTGTEVYYSGPAAFPVTPDSPAADPLEAPAPSFASFNIAVRPRTPIEPGGKIRIEQGYLFKGRPVYGENLRYAFPDPVLDPRSEPNHLSVNASVPFRVALVPTGFGRHAPEVTLPEGLPAGGEVLFCFGDRSQGSPGLAVPTFPLKVRFLAFLDPQGDGQYRLASGTPPEVEAFAWGADRLQVTVPSITYAGEISVKIVPLRGTSGRERSALPVADYSGEVELALEGEEGLHLGRARFRKGDRFQEVRVILPGPGLYRIKVRSGTALEGESNAVLYLTGASGDGAFEVPRLCLKGRHIFWGSLQNHTALGGHAASLPHEAYRCAREEGALDFCALTDHSSNPAFHWEELRELPDAYNDPGRFVAFPGYEWTSGQFGHRHIIFRDGGETLACSERPTEDPCEVHAPDLASLSARVGSDPNALLVVHHARRALDSTQSRYLFGDPEMLPRQRLFEIFSWQGSSEGAAEDWWINGREDRTLRSGSGFRDALAAGYPFGVTADSDGHLGRPGVAISIRRKAGLRYGFSGQTAVICNELTREGLFRGLEERCCYGTTGARILLFLMAGDGGIGEEVTCREGTVRIRAMACGTASIQRLQLLADGHQVVHESQPNQRETALDLQVPIMKDKRCFYVRLEQADGHMAWSSPVWVQPADTPKKD